MMTWTYLVASSKSNRISSAFSGPPAQMKSSLSKAEQTAGRSGWPKILHRLLSLSWIQRTPEGLPFGMPGMGELIEGAMQHAPQPRLSLTEIQGDQSETSIAIVVMRVPLNGVEKFKRGDSRGLSPLIPVHFIYRR